MQTITDILGPAGPLAAHVPGFAARSQQHRAALELDQRRIRVEERLEVFFVELVVADRQCPVEHEPWSRAAGAVVFFGERDLRGEAFEAFVAR